VEAIPYLMKTDARDGAHVAAPHLCTRNLGLGQSTTQTSTEMRWAGWNGEAAPPILCPFAIEEQPPLSNAVRNSHNVRGTWP